MTKFLQLAVVVLTSFFLVGISESMSTETHDKESSASDDGHAAKVEFERLQRKAKALWSEGRILDSYNAGEAAVDFARRSFGPRSIELAFILVNHGITVRNLWGGDRPAAMFSEALSIYEALYGAKSERGQSALFFLAEQQAYAGRRVEAESLMRRAIEVVTLARGPKDPEVGTAKSRLAMMKRDWGQLDEAFALFTEAIEILAANGRYWSVVSLGPFAGAIGALIDQGRYEDAQIMIIQAKIVVRLAWLSAPTAAKSPSGLPSFEKQIYLSEVRLHLKKNNHKAARVAAETAVTLSEKHGGKKSLHLLDSLQSLSDVAIAEGKYAESEAIARRRLLISQTAWSETTTRFIALWRAIALAQYRQGNHAGAITNLVKAIEIATLPQNRDTLSERAVFLQEAADYLLKSSAKHISTKSRDELWEKAFEIVQWRQRGSPGLAMAQASARLEAGDQAVGKLVRSREATLAEVKETEIRLTQELGRLTASRDNSKVSLLRKLLAEKTGLIASLDKKVASDAPLYSDLSTVTPVSLRELMALLKNDEVVLVLSDGDPTIVLAINKTYFAWKAIPHEQVAPRLLRLRCSVVYEQNCGRNFPELSPEDKALSQLEGRSTYSLTTAHALYKTIFSDDIGEVIRGRQHMYVLSSGIFSTFPLGALVTKDPPNHNPNLDTLRSAPWLIRNHSITNLVSLLSFTRARRHTTNVVDRPFLGIGDPKLADSEHSSNCAPAATTSSAKARAPSLISDDPTISQEATGRGRLSVVNTSDLPSLPDSRCELEAIAALLAGANTDVLLQEKATETNVKELSADGTLRLYKTLAFATHGLTAGELKQPEPSLVLSPPADVTSQDDGLLTASEVAALDLDANWVILSACNTAAGNSQGDDTFGGLARAFFYAGARGALVAHWPVFSDAAVRLTTYTIEEIREHPTLARADAMRAAALRIIETADDEFTADPAYWAPFSYVGIPN